MLLISVLVISGCMDSTQSQMDEEKESNFQMGQSRVKAMDYPGAIESFERALEVNPKSGSAHFELACLFENRQLDPAAAIYHYQTYLKLRPNAENTEIVNQHVLALKQEMVKTVSLGPITERQQKDFERLVEENKRLNDEIEKWRAYAARLQALTNPATGPAVAAPRATTRPALENAAGGGNSSAPMAVAREPEPAATTRKTHVVKAGETPSVIARNYGIRVETLMAANPRLDARRMRVGQTLVIPSKGL
jgi:LysM repeat protein